MNLIDNWLDLRFGKVFLYFDTDLLPSCMSYMEACAEVTIKVALKVQESQFKNPAKSLNFGTIDHSAFSIQLRTQSKQSKAEDEFLAGNFSCLDLTVKDTHLKFH